MSSAAWSGRKVAEARAYVARQIEAGAGGRGGVGVPCGECGEPVLPGQAFVVGHKVPRWERPDLTWEPSNWRAEHKRCSDSTGKRHADEAMRRRVLAEVGVSSPAGGPESRRPLPFSLSEVRSGLSWPDFVRSCPDWLHDLMDVPADASPPLWISPLPAEATGSYGFDACDWIERVEGKTLRWWQRLAIVLQLVHDADGVLVHREVLESAPRRAGKSVRVRGMALWRLEHGPALFGETQTVVHTGSDIAICREIQRGAWRWAEGTGWTATRANGKEAIESPGGDRWLVRSQDGVYGYDVGLGIVDEGWKVKPDTVSEGLEPATLERPSPQLHLTSTAHRRATSLMKSRLLSALTTPSPGVLLLVWAAPPDADPGDPDVWRAASPHWSEDRRRLIASKYEKALAGETDPEADDLDPMEGFKAQYLNMWRLRTPNRERGEAVTDADAWAALTAEAPLAVPDAAAIESWFGDGCSLVLGWRTGGTTTVTASDHETLADAVRALRESGYAGQVRVGKSLAEDPALRGVRCKGMAARTGAAITTLARLLADDAVRHDGSPHLAGQVLAARTLPGADGPRMVSQERADAIKAAVWTVEALRSTKGKIRVLTASS